MFKNHSKIPRSWWNNWVTNLLMDWLPNIETISLGCFVGLGVWLHQRSGGNFLPEGEKLLNGLKESSYIWLPAATTLTINFTNSVFSRLREGRDTRRMQTLEYEKSLYNEMQVHLEKGEKSLELFKFPLALEQFNAARFYFSQLFDKEIRLQARQLQLSCIYNEALCSFYLNNYNTALSTLNEILSSSLAQTNMHGLSLLYNLRGLIHYKLSELPLATVQTKQSELVKSATSDFQHSLVIDKTQNYVLLILKFLNAEKKADYDFIANNIPNPVFKPVINLTITNSKNNILSEAIPYISAVACMKIGNWPYAICLLKRTKESIRISGCCFLDIMQLNFKLIKSYNKLCENKQKNDDVKLLEPKSIKNTESGQQQFAPEEINLKVSEIQKRKDDLLQEIIVYLGMIDFNEKDTISIEILTNYLNYGLFCKEAILYFNELKTNTNEVETMKNHFKKYTDFVTNYIKIFDKPEDKDLKNIIENSMEINNLNKQTNM